MLAMTMFCASFEASWRDFTSKQCIHDTGMPVDLNDSLLLPFNASTEGCLSGTGHCRHFYQSLPRVLSASQARAQSSAHCLKKSKATSLPSSVAMLSCASQGPVNSRVRLLIGVMSSPRARDRRDGIRATWMKWPSVGQDVLVCFALGRIGPSAEILEQLDAEAQAHQDIVFLHDTPDGCTGMHMHVAKAYQWWRYATVMLGAHLQAHIVKTDDDAQLHLPWLQAQLDPLRCIENLYFGPMVWVGFNPKTLKQCGWDWSSPKNYVRYGCALRGFHPAFPFALGALEVLSLPLARRVATSTSISNFVRATRMRPVVIEDPILGFWVSAERLKLRPPDSVVYVKAYVGNLNCRHQNAGGGRMLNQSVGMHNLKSQSSQLYAWDLLHNQHLYHEAECSERTNVHHPKWKGAEHWNAVVQTTLSLRGNPLRPFANNE